MTENNKMIDKLQSLILELDVVVISALSENNYKSFILNFFSKVNKLKNNGLNINESIKKFIDDRYYDISIYFDDNPIYEERIQDIFTELTEFCSPPLFWSTSFEIYMMYKWGIFIPNEDLE